MNILDIDPAVVVDAQWADNGPGWRACSPTPRQSWRSIRRLVDSGRFSVVGVIGPYPPHSEVDFEVRAFVPQAPQVKTRHRQPQRRTRSMADRVNGRQAPTSPPREPPLVDAVGSMSPRSATTSGSAATR